MPSITLTIPEIPDPRFGPFRAAAGGDVRRACFESAEQVLRLIADLPDGGGHFMSLRMLYSPTNDRLQFQDRLRILLTLGATTLSDLNALGTAIQCGPLSRFYRFGPVDRTPSAFESTMLCDIVRRAWVTRPLVPQDRNPHVPPYYFSIEPFSPDPENDYQMLDRVFSGLSEPVEIQIAIGPFHSGDLIDAQAEYIRRMESINRRWSDDEAETPPEEDFLGASETWALRGLRARPKPFHHSDPLADEQLRLYRRLQESLHEPQLSFHLRVLARSPAVARLVGSVLGNSTFREGGFALIAREAREGGHENQGVVPCPPELALPPRIESSSFADLLPLVHVAPVSELVGAVRLPVSGAASPCCIRRNTDPAPPPPDTARLVVGRDLEVWTTDHRGGLDQILSLETLTKHLTIFGLSGSGKSTFVMDLLIQLHERGIPFIVFETAKREYRALKRFRGHADSRVRALADALQVYTLGAEQLSPLRFNPLESLGGGSVDEDVEQLMMMFEAAVPLVGPLPALFREGLLELLRTRHRDAPAPVLADLRAAVEWCLAAKHYAAETNSDIRAALDVRLGLLTEGLTGRVFQSPTSSPTIKQLVSGSTIIELDRLPPEAKGLIYFGLKNAVARYLRSVPHTGRLRLASFVEEAHNVVGTSTEGRVSEEAADPRAFAAEATVTALAEDRAQGIAHVIIDQLPSAVAPQVVKNTGTKIAFRQVAIDDREVLGGAMLCDDAELQEMARLCPGEAYFFTEGHFRPRRVRTRNLHATTPELSRPCGDDELLMLVRDDAWRTAVEQDRRGAELDRLRRVLDRFDARRREVGERVRALRTSARPAPVPASSTRISAAPRVAQGVLRTALRLRNEILHDLEVLRLMDIPRLLGDPPSTGSTLWEWWDSLCRRWEDVIMPDTRAWLARVDRWFFTCRGA